MLATNLGKVQLRNPTVLSAGFLGTSAASLLRVAESGAGAVTTKSIGPVYREGHNNPIVVEYPSGLINAVGLPSPGYKEMDKEWDQLKELNVPLIISIYGNSVNEFREVAEAVAQKGPAMLEVNISCPNTEKGQIFGTNVELTREVVSTVKDVAGKVPIMLKLTPNTPNIVEIAKACEEAGANAISAINTLGPGMLIDINARKPILHFKTGGVSGPAVFPIAVRCIYQIHENVSLPILGIGGIVNSEDAIQMMMAGASAVGIASAIHYKGIEVFNEICTGIEKYLKENSFSNVKDIVGIAHD